MSDAVYVIDTNSLVELSNHYPSATFHSLWSRLQELVDRGKLIAPRRVYDELLEYGGESEVVKWATRNQKMFKDENSAEFIQLLAEITNKHSNWVDVDSEKNKADPYIVALARLTKANTRLTTGEVVVVSEESTDPKRLKIPSVCAEYKIRCIKLLQLFETEGWKF